MGDSAKINPVLTSEFGLIQHKAEQFSAEVPGSYKKSDLEDPDLWVNVASRMKAGSEIRCIAEDMSFVGYGICTFAQGSTAKIKITSFHKLDSVVDIKDNDSGYKAQLRGSKKWCIVKQSDGSIVKEGIVDQKTALRDLEDYLKALRS